MKKFLPFLTKHYPKILIGFFFISLLIFYARIFATTVYQPGDTLDPTEGPGLSTVDFGGTTYTNANGTTVALGGIDVSTTFSNQTMTQMFNQLLYPYVAPTGNITTSLTTSSSYIANSVSPATIDVTWGVTKSAADSNGDRYFIRSGTAITATRAGSPSGAEPDTHLTTGQGNDTNTGNVVTYTPTTGSYNVANGTAVFSFTAYPCSVVQSAAGSACSAGTGVSSSLTVYYRSPVYWGTSTNSNGASLTLSTDLTGLTLAASSSRTAIGSHSFALSGGEYIYFAWPQNSTYDPAAGCYYTGHQSGTHCFHTALGDVDDFIRTNQTVNGIDYYVYRSLNTNVTATYTIQ